MAEKRATAALKQVAALYKASDDAARDYISRNHDEEMKHGVRNYTRGLLVDIQV